MFLCKSCRNLTMFDNAKDIGSRLPKPLKTSRHLIDSVFQQADEALKCAERRPTAQKRGSARLPLYTTLASNIFLSLHSLWIKQEIIDTNH